MSTGDDPESCAAPAAADGCIRFLEKALRTRGSLPAAVKRVERLAAEEPDTDPGGVMGGKAANLCS